MTVGRQAAVPFHLTKRNRCGCLRCGERGRGADRSLVKACELLDMPALPFEQGRRRSAMRSNRSNSVTGLWYAAHMRYVLAGATVAAMFLIAVCGEGDPDPEPIARITPQSTSTPTPTDTPEPTATATAIPTPTVTPEPSATPEPTATATAIPTPTVTPEPSATPEPTATATAVPTPTVTPEPSATPEPTATATAVPTPTVTPEPSATPEPTATAAPRIISQEEKDELLADIDGNKVIANAVVVLENEHPIFQAVTTRALFFNEGWEVYDAVYQYTGDPDAPYAATQGTHLKRKTGLMHEYDSTWYSTCYRQVRPTVSPWLYNEHDGWGERRLDTFIPVFPLASLFIPNADWEPVDLFRLKDATFDELKLAVMAVIDHSETYVFIFHPHQHPFRVAFEENYMGIGYGEDTWLLFSTEYFYDVEKAPVVHESQEDCLARNDP